MCVCLTSFASKFRVLVCHLTRINFLEALGHILALVKLVEHSIHASGFSSSGLSGKVGLRRRGRRGRRWSTASRGTRSRGTVDAEGLRIATLGVPDQAGGLVLHDKGFERVEQFDEGSAPLDVELVRVLEIFDHSVGVELGAVTHLGDIGTRLGFNSDPSDSRDALADSAEVVEELLVAAVPVPDLSNLDKSSLKGL